MTLAYGEIFAQRGDAYHRAMLRFPHARDMEFARLFEGVSPRAGQRVLDIPAGGGYLRDHLAPGLDLTSLELSDGFGTGIPVYDPTQAWSFGTFDHIVCLAALHHIEDQAGFLRTLLQHLGPTGTLHLADVPAGSGITHFLDDFVGRYNVTGHGGRYLAPERAWFSALGHVARIELCSCPWAFRDEATMLAFCSGLFGLVDCPEEALRDALAKYVGVHRAGGMPRVDWQLLYVDLQPA